MTGEIDRLDEISEENCQLLYDSRRKWYGRIFTWLDASYAIHDHMNSQTGGTMPFWDVTVQCQSSEKSLTQRVHQKQIY